MLSIVYRKTKRMANTTTQNNRTNGNKYMEITITKVEIAIPLRDIYYAWR